MTSEFISKKELMKCLEILTPENALACEVALETGLRINDILSLKSETLLNGPKFEIKEQKTGKRRNVRLPSSLFSRLRAFAGSQFVFEHRTNPDKHRTRQAVWKDIKRAGKAFRVKPNLTPHSLRKIFAVELLKKGTELSRIQKIFNHENEAVTAIYALADKIRRKRKDRTPCTARRAVKTTNK